MSFENPSPVPGVLWVEHVGHEQPEQTCNLTHPGEYRGEMYCPSGEQK